jgi:hypothetical protein
MIDSEEKIYIASLSFSFTFVKQGRHQRKNNVSKIQAKFRREKNSVHFPLAMVYIVYRRIIRTESRSLDLFKKNFEHNKDLQSCFNRQTTKKCYKKEFEAPFNCPK